MDGALVGVRWNTIFSFNFVKIDKIDKNAAKLFKFTQEKKTLNNPKPQFFREKKTNKLKEKNSPVTYIHLWNSILLTRGKNKVTWSQNFQPLMLVCAKTCFLPGNCKKQLHRWNATFAYIMFHSKTVEWYDDQQKLMAVEVTALAEKKKNLHNFPIISLFICK